MKTETATMKTAMKTDDNAATEKTGSRRSFLCFLVFKFAL